MALHPIKKGNFQFILGLLFSDYLGIFPERFGLFQSAWNRLCCLLTLPFFYAANLTIWLVFLVSAVSVSEVEALFELYKSISSSVIDDGLISKVKFCASLVSTRDFVFSLMWFEIRIITYDVMFEFVMCCMVLMTLLFGCLPPSLLR